MHGGKSYGAGLEAIQESVELLIRRLAAILAPEAQQIGLPLFIGKLGQILGTTGILVILE